MFLHAKNLTKYGKVIQNHGFDGSSEVSRIRA